MNEVNWGERYFDHYERFFREPSSVAVHQTTAELPTVQVLRYQNVFRDTVTYLTLGLTHYHEVRRVSADGGRLCPGQGGGVIARGLRRHVPD